MYRMLENVVVKDNQKHPVYSHGPVYAECKVYIVATRDTNERKCLSIQQMCQFLAEFDKTCAIVMKALCF